MDLMPPKNRIVALILSLFLGLIAADRFYLGKHKTGLLKLLTLGGLTIWWFIDAMLLLLDAFLYTLGRDTGIVKDANGRDLRYGLSLVRFQGGKLERDWFRR